MLSIITTCKDRLFHLKRTLPHMLQQTRAEVIVVDYGCSHGTAAWVRVNFPTAKVVEVRDDPGFSVARARNIGARHSNGALLCFADADVRLTQDLTPWLDINLHPRHFYVAPQARELAGFVVLARSDFASLGGYDEAIRGWGAEDMDLYDRLEYAGMNRSELPIDFLSAIKHGDELRQIGMRGPFPDKKTALLFNRIYREIKADVRRLAGKDLDIVARTEIYGILVLWARNENDALQRVKIVIELPMQAQRNAPIMPQRKLMYGAPFKEAT